ncbi:MAG TPA: M15 family metallopeptidase [Candidatus Aminicenantes bacterium]|nr:M15 family metallopeptidase [Candidatus Aminicenantes bacterium]
MKNSLRRTGRLFLATAALGLLVLPACRVHNSVFRIEPVRPIADLQREALTVSPPPQSEGLRASELVDLVPLIPSARLDIRYASERNFLGTPVYPAARALLQRPAAKALARVAEALKARGFGLLIHDAYRPWSVTWVFWQATPADQHGFVASPAKGSVHNRGCAIDLSLYRLADGRPVTMPSGYDEFSPRAAAAYPGGTAKQRQLRDLLRQAMMAEGFKPITSEWWHFDYRDSALYPVLNVPFPTPQAD